MLKLPVLSGHRPWPTLILRAGKDPENRPWATSYRGDLLIAGAIKWDARAIPFTCDLAETPGDHRAGLFSSTISKDPNDHPRGIVGVVELYDICTVTFDNPADRCDCPAWAFPGQKHWRIRNPREFAQPIPDRGYQNLWYPTDAAWPAVEEQLRLVGRA
jgi:hypothetical protein